MIFKLFIILTGLSAALSAIFFRKDYTYDDQHDAFYKLIWSEEGNSFDDAVMACDNEGSQLFYPKDHSEWIVINNLSETLPETFNTTDADVLLGIRDEVGNGEYLTLDGHIVRSNILYQDGLLPLDCVVMDLTTGALKATSCKVETDSRLFVCKKTDNSPCPTIDEGYKYVEDTKKCYKINPRKKSWKDALQTCYMEGGILVVVESNTEANSINSILSEFGENQNFHSGFRKISDKYYTLKGKKIEDSYNRRLSGNDQQPALNCGLLTTGYSNYQGRNGLFISSTDCEDLNPFICELQARF